MSSSSRLPRTRKFGGSWISASRGSRSSRSSHSTGTRPTLFTVTTTATVSPALTARRLHSRSAVTLAMPERARIRLAISTAKRAYMAYATRPSPNASAITRKIAAAANHFMACPPVRGKCSWRDSLCDGRQRRDRHLAYDFFDHGFGGHFAQPALWPHDQSVRHHGGDDSLHVVRQNVFATQNCGHRLRRAKQRDRCPWAATQAQFLVRSGLVHDLHPVAAHALVDTSLAHCPLTGHDFCG